MERKMIEEQLLQIFRLVLGREVGSDVRRAVDSGWDSLQHMQIIFAIEEEFQVRFTEEEIPKLNSLSEFAEAITQHSRNPLERS